MAECASLPASRSVWPHGDPDGYNVPDVFDSQLMGVEIPFGAVLELAGAQARFGSETTITVESLDPLVGAVLRCENHRFIVDIMWDSIGGTHPCGRPDSPQKRACALTRTGATQAPCGIDSKDG